MLTAGAVLTALAVTLTGSIGDRTAEAEGSASRPPRQAASEQAPSPAPSPTPRPGLSPLAFRTGSRPRPAGGLPATAGSPREDRSATGGYRAPAPPAPPVSRAEPGDPQDRYGQDGRRGGYERDGEEYGRDAEGGQGAKNAPEVEGPGRDADELPPGKTKSPKKQKN
ncbi:hypothetical protein [Streptomyces sudanensis]|uniref:hypothetical protein n=1 Tax=Streptomyces sudanensis TaxID=436397 RepID=UPI0020CBCCFE|nr:hypothetical protein [Streptomyces sudanensis]MCP9960152.1 hypothetical protein [Streptomyces sudanensis]